MTRTEKILILYKSIFGKDPTSEELYVFDSYNESVPLETISATMTKNIAALYLPSDSEALVKAAFQTIFGYSNEEMNTIILEQAKIAFQGGIDGFQYWVSQLENSPFISRDTIYIALLNGADEDTLSNMSLDLETYINTYDVWLTNKENSIAEEVAFSNITFYGTNIDDTIEVNSTIQNVYALNGNDTVITSEIDTYVELGAGNDIVYSNIGNDIIYGGTGDDYIFSDLGDDTIYAESGNDVIYAESGNDIVYSGEGNDTIYSGEGNNEIYSSSGEDKIYLGIGNNLVESGDDDDFIYGNTGNDQINSGSGNDTIYGGEGSDFINSFSGDDIIYAGAGSDIIYGNLGNDVIYAGEEDDIIYAEAGDDIINSGSGADIIYGGDGKDTFLFLSGDNNLSSIDIIKDYSINEDKIQFEDDNLVNTINNAYKYNNTLTFSENIDTLCSYDLSTSSSLNWFIYDGFTYIIKDISANLTFVDGSDLILSIQGVLDLTDVNIELI